MNELQQALAYLAGAKSENQRIIRLIKDRQAECCAYDATKCYKHSVLQEVIELLEKEEK